MKRSNTRQWAYPVTDWKVLFYFIQSEKEWVDDFYTMSSLTNYFTDVPERGLLIGFGTELPQHRARQSFVPCTNGKLGLWYVESGKETHHEFSDFNTFIKYLNEHVNIAKALSYTSVI